MRQPPQEDAPSTLEAVAAAPSEAAASPLAKARAWGKKYAKIDKATIASLGFDAFFTYGFVSNINGERCPRSARLVDHSLR